MTPIRVAAALALCVMGVGCTEEIGPRPDLDPPDVTRSGSIGTAEDFFGMSTRVVDVATFSQTPNGFPRLAVTLRSENTTDRRSQNPDIQLKCDESPTGGDWYRGSTWEPSGLVDAGSVNEGIVYIAFPAKPGNLRYSVPTCTGAQLMVTGTDMPTRARVIVGYPISADVINEAVNQPQGPSLPLPQRTN